MLRRTVDYSRFKFFGLLFFWLFFAVLSLVLYHPVLLAVPEKRWKNVQIDAEVEARMLSFFVTMLVRWNFCLLVFVWTLGRLDVTWRWIFLTGFEEVHCVLCVTFSDRWRTECAVDLVEVFVDRSTWVLISMMREVSRTAIGQENLQWGGIEVSQGRISFVPPRSVLPGKRRACIL